MAVVNITPDRAYQNYGWRIIFGLELLSLLSVPLFLFADSAQAFMTNTGVAWTEFSEAYPSVASLYASQRSGGEIGDFEFWLCMLAITYFGLRPGHRWAWFAKWILPIRMIHGAIGIAQLGHPMNAAIIAGFGMLAVVGLLLPVRKFFPGRT